MLRKFALIAFASVGLLLGGCSTAQIQSEAATVESEIQSFTSAACGFIPTVTTILQVVAAVTGTSSVLGIADTAISAVESDICSAVPATASAAYKALPKAAVGRPPVTVGSVNGVPVQGWRTQ